MRWIIDAQLTPALEGLLIERGHQAEHVKTVGMHDASDGLIWDYALENTAIILTKDEDFQTRAMVVKVAPVVVWLRIGNCSRRALLEWFEPLLDGIEERLEKGDPLIEVRQQPYLLP